MPGQGSPTTIAAKAGHRFHRNSPSGLPTSLAATVVRVLLMTVVIVIAFGIPADSIGNPLQGTSTVDELDLRLRISLGGGAPAKWIGQISVEGSSNAFSDLTQLGLNEDANLAIRLTDGRIRIDHVVETDYNAIDVSVRASAESTLSVDLAPADHPEQRTQYSIALRDLLEESDHREIDSSGNRCSINRAPGDMLRFEIERPHLIFSPGEPIEFTATAIATPFISKACQCRVAITHARREKNAMAPWRKTTTLSCDHTGSSAPVNLTLKAPSSEGVYDLTLELQENSFSSNFISQSKVTRKVQLIVLEKSAPQETKNKRWKSFADFTPQQLLDGEDSSWQEQFPTSINPLKSRRLGRGKTQSCLGNSRRRVVETQQGPALQLEPGGWQAIPIPTSKPNDLCLIEVDCLIHDDTALGVSLLQFDAAGQVSSRPQDSGIVSDRTRIGTAKTGFHTHRLYHWPNGSDAWLVLANRHAERNSEIISIRVSTGPNRIPEPMTVSASTSNRLPYRRLMAYLETPSFTEDFGASKHVDPILGQPLDDWMTFYQGAGRLIQSLKSKQLAGAFVSIAADGSSLFPSRTLNAGPRFDSGTFLSNGNDPMRKDVVELLFRMFEREGLQLVPLITLNGQLSGINSTAQTKLVNRNGVTATQQSTAQLPRYNPLAPSVQNAVADVVQEVVDRYRHHKTFRSITISCRPDTVSLLPGQQWACDRATIQRFLNESNADDQFEFDSLNQQPQTAAFLNSHNEQWLNWRAGEMTKLYRRLETIVTRSLPDGKLYLAPTDLYRNAEFAAAMTPNLHTPGDYAEAMLRLGIDEAWTGKNPRTDRITILNPHRIAPSEPLASSRVDQHIARLDQMNTFFRNSVGGGDLFIHRSTWAHFAQLQQEAPFQNQRGPLMRRQHLIPTGTTSQRRLVERIKHTDPKLLVDSVWALPCAPDRSFVSFAQVFSQLPAANFVDVAVMDDANELTNRSSQSLPVAIRQFSNTKGTWFYAANASPWPIRVRVQLARTGSAPPKFQSLSNISFEPGRQHEAQQMEFTIPAWGLAGGHSPAPESRLLAYAIEFPPDIDIQLKKEIFRLQSLLVQSGQSTHLGGLANPSFELEVNAPTRIHGWSHGPERQASVSVKIDHGNAQDGGSALHLSSQSDTPTWVRSNEFAAPDTGRASISVWLKTDQPNQPLPLRISLEGSSGGSSYYRFGSIGSVSPVGETNQVNTQWKRFAVHFDDLPLDDLDRLRVGFDLMGPGSVMIDHVEVFDRWFDENDSQAITQLLATAGTLLSTPATYDRCRRLLESYWPRFLLEHFKTGSPKQAMNSRSKPPTSAMPASFASPDQHDANAKSELNETPAPRQGILRFRNVFGPRRPKVR